jgi:maltose O-acetyltransferase
MIDREGMALGEPYDSRAPALLEQARRARALLAEYNTSAATETDRRRAILEALLGRVAPGVWIEPPFFCDYGSQIAIGRDTFVNVNNVFLDAAPITIGDSSLIGPAVQILTATHPLRAADRIRTAIEPGTAPYVTFARPIQIGNRVWLGAGAIVLPGVTIGDDVTVGAGSVVTKDLPAGVLAVGNPCRVIREL